MEASRFPPSEPDGDFSGTGTTGTFGLSSDWREAILIPGKGKGPDNTSPTMRGGYCVTDAHQEEVRQILLRRNNTPATSKVNVVQSATLLPSTAFDSSHYVPLVWQ